MSVLSSPGSFAWFLSAFLAMWDGHCSQQHAGEWHLAPGQEDSVHVLCCSSLWWWTTVGLSKWRHSCAEPRNQVFSPTCVKSYASWLWRSTLWCYFFTYKVGLLKWPHFYTLRNCVWIWRWWPQRGWENTKGCRNSTLQSHLTTVHMGSRIDSLGLNASQATY